MCQKLSQNFLGKSFLANVLQMHIKGKWKALCTPEIIAHISK